MGIKSLTGKLREDEKVTLFDGMQMVGTDGLDISDDVWDWAVWIPNLGRADEDAGEMLARIEAEIKKDQKEEDKSKQLEKYYDWVMAYLTTQFELINLDSRGYTCCKVAEFIHENIDKFDAFYNRRYKKEYQPQNMDKEELETMHEWDADEGFYDFYMNGIESLISGGFSEKAYKNFYEIFKK